MFTAIIIEDQTEINVGIPAKSLEEAEDIALNSFKDVVDVY